MAFSFGVELKYKLLVWFKHKKIQINKLISNALLIRKLRLLLIKHRKKSQKLNVHYKLQIADNMFLKRRLARQKRRRKSKQQSKQRRLLKRLQN